MKTELKRYQLFAQVTLIVLVLITLFFAWQSSRIRFSYDFEEFFPENREIVAYREFKDTFLSNIEPIWIGIDLESNVFDNNNLARIRALSSDLRNIPRVRRVQSITSLKIPLSTGFGVLFDTYVHPDDSTQNPADSMRLLRSPLLLRTFVSEDLQHTAILLQTTYELSKQETDTLGRQIKEAVWRSGFRKTHVAGRLIDQSVIVDNLMSETAFFFFLSAAIVCLVLFLLYRSWLAVIVPLLVVLSAVIWLVGTMAYFGKDIDVLTTLAPTILFIVGVSDIIHFLSRYLDDFRKHSDKLKAVRKAINEVGVATLITSLTTAIGFFSLLTSPIEPVRSFGMYIGYGVIVAYVLAFTLLPAVIILTPDRLAGFGWFRSSGNHWMQTLFRAVLRNRRFILLAHLAVLLISLIAVQFVKSDQYLTEELPRRHSLTRAFHYMEAHFSGVRAVEVAIHSKSDLLLTDLNLVRQIDAIEKHLKEEYRAGSLISPATNWKLSHQIASGGDPEQFRIPGNVQEFSSAKPYYQKISRSAEKRLVLNSDETQGRISGQMPDIGAYAFLQKQATFEAYCAQYAPDLNVRMTGLPYLLNLNNAEISKSMMQGIALAFLIVSLLMAVLYRDPLMIIIALIPNVLPLLFTGLLMVVLGIDLKVSTSLLFSVLFGIAVDDTIHILSKMKIELAQGRSYLYAIKRAMIATGQALVLTSIILCAGFISLVFSDFNSSFLFGLLLSIGLTVALLADLLLLPVLLILRKSIPFRRIH